MKNYKKTMLLIGSLTGWVVSTTICSAKITVDVNYRKTEKEIIALSNQVHIIDGKVTTLEGQTVTLSNQVFVLEGDVTDLSNRVDGVQTELDDKVNVIHHGDVKIYGKLEALGGLQISSDWDPVFVGNNDNPWGFWTDVSVSSDGKYQLSSFSIGYLYGSDNYGTTWTVRNGSNRWHNAAISDSGQYQSIITLNDRIHVSSDYGHTWNLKDSSRNWQAISMSGSGQHQSAVVWYGKIYTSDDYGNTWNEISVDSRAWNTISVSQSGQYQVAGAGHPADGYIYTSDDYGATWTERLSDSSLRFIKSAISSCGKYQTLIDREAFFSRKIYASDDYGVTWSIKWTTGIWTDIAMDGSGQYRWISAGSVSSPDNIYMSDDYGETFSSVATIQPWSTIASSKDALVIIAGIESTTNSVYLNSNTMSAPGELKSDIITIGDESRTNWPITTLGITEDDAYRGDWGDDVSNRVVELEVDVATLNNLRHSDKYVSQERVEYFHSGVTYHVSLGGSDTNTGLDKPNAFKDIQYAINYSTNGDTIFVYSGIYEITNEIVINKDVRVVGVNGAANTIIKPEDGVQTRCMYIYETKKAVIDGFTFENGYTTLSGGNINSGNGGGVVIWQDVGSSPSELGSLLINCIIQNCYAQQYGGGIHLMDHKSAIINSIIRNCSTETSVISGGGGISMRWEGYVRN